MQKTKKQILNTMEGEHEFYSDDLEANIKFYYSPDVDVSNDCPGDSERIELLYFSCNDYDEHDEDDYLLACAEHISLLVEKYESDEIDYLIDLRREN